MMAWACITLPVYSHDCDNHYNEYLITRHGPVLFGFEFSSSYVSFYGLQGIGECVCGEGGYSSEMQCR